MPTQGVALGYYDLSPLGSFEILCCPKVSLHLFLALLDKAIKEILHHVLHARGYSFGLMRNENHFAFFNAGS